MSDIHFIKHDGTINNFYDQSRQMNYYGSQQPHRHAEAAEDAEIVGEVKDEAAAKAVAPAASAEGLYQKITAAIRQLCDEGVMKNKAHWFAIYRVLVFHYGFAKDMKAFERTVERRELDSGLPEACRFSYESLVKASQSYTAMGRVDNWDDLSTTGGAREQQLVARRLTELLLAAP